MPVAARPLPRPTGRRPTSPPVRGRRPPPTPTHHAPPKADDTVRTVLIVTAVAIATVVGVGIVWEYGSARNLPAQQEGADAADTTAGAESGRRAAKPTLFYRDMRDGRVMVMEVGPDGTRIKGTVDKGSLAITGDSSEDGSRSAPDPSSVDRVNALGSAFR